MHAAQAPGLSLCSCSAFRGSISGSPDQDVSLACKYVNVCLIVSFLLQILSKILLQLTQPKSFMQINVL